MHSDGRNVNSARRAKAINASEMGQKSQKSQNFVQLCGWFDTHRPNYEMFTIPRRTIGWQIEIETRNCELWFEQRATNSLAIRNRTIEQVTFRGLGWLGQGFKNSKILVMPSLCCETFRQHPKKLRKKGMFWIFLPTSKQEKYYHLSPIHGTITRVFRYELQIELRSFRKDPQFFVHSTKLQRVEQ